MGSGSGVGGRGWSVFDAVRAFPPHTTPEALMADVNTAIAAAEHAHASSLSALPETPASAAPEHDARLADEAYKAACSALAAGRPDAALKSLRVALANCPREKTSAIAKLRSLVSIASQQQKQKQERDQERERDHRQIRR